MSTIQYAHFFRRIKLSHKSLSIGLRALSETALLDLKLFLLLFNKSFWIKASAKQKCKSQFCFKGDIGCKIHFYTVFAYTCDLAVCVQPPNDKNPSIPIFIYPQITNHFDCLSNIMSYYLSPAHNH